MSEHSNASVQYRATRLTQLKVSSRDRLLVLLPRLSPLCSMLATDNAGHGRAGVRAGVTPFQTAAALG
jgi:hypothetical protein